MRIDPSSLIRSIDVESQQTAAFTALPVTKPGQEAVTEQEQAAEESLPMVPAGEPESDEALAVRGDAESFVRLYRTHVWAVYRYLLARLGQPQDAEDVTSLAFEHAWISLPRYRPIGSFRGWLFTIVQRTLFNYRRGRTLPAVPIDTLAEILTDSAEGPEAQAIRREQVRQVLQVIATLSPEQQEVIRLRFLAELRYPEIAQVLGKGESAVKMTLYRALKEIERRHPNDEAQS